MSEKNSHIDFNELIVKYLCEQTSDAEMQQLETWVLADPSNKAQFIAAKKAWMLTGMANEKRTQSLNVDQLLAQTNQKIKGKAKIVELQPKVNRRRWLSIAAAIALLVTAGLWVFLNKATDGPMIVSTTDVKKEFKLDDGSQITLNQAATLTYEASNNLRKVNLKGDAYFDVARDENKPFVINTEDIEIEVLGTSFYVDARKSIDEIQVMVASGSVAVRHGDDEVILKANEKAVFKKENDLLVKTENKDPYYQSIKTNELIFGSTKFEEVVYVLNRHFNAQITIENPILKDCELEATYSQKSLDAVLTLIQASFPTIKINRSGKVISFSGTQCE